jgi:predicted O-methyltransferase YrrM
MPTLRSSLPQWIKQPAGRLRNGLRVAIRKAKKRLNRPNLYSLASSERAGVVFTAPSDMKIDERFFLYAFVRGFRPQRALEIGVLNGGGGCIMANAMEENGMGRIVGIDPHPDLKVPDKHLHGRYEVISAPSPDGIATARERAGGDFDFVLVDGLHIHRQAVEDIRGLIPYLADGAYVLFHDAFHYGVAAAIGEAVHADPRLIDCGYVCRTARMNADPNTPYNGFRLLRFSTVNVMDAFSTVAPLYSAAGLKAPAPDQSMLDHDVWYCRAIQPCPRCATKAAKGSLLAVS